MNNSQPGCTPDQPMRLLAPRRPKIAITPEIAVTACSTESVRAPLSRSSTGKPSSDAAALATVTTEAQMVRDRYQGLMAVIENLLLQLRSNRMLEGSPSPAAPIWRTVKVTVVGTPPKSAVTSAAG